MLRALTRETYTEGDRKTPIKVRHTAPRVECPRGYFRAERVEARVGPFRLALYIWTL